MHQTRSTVAAVNAFFADRDVAARAKLDSIITVADAKNLTARLADSREAVEQIASSVATDMADSFPNSNRSPNESASGQPARADAGLAVERD